MMLGEMLDECSAEMLDRAQHRGLSELTSRAAPFSGDMQWRLSFFFSFFFNEWRLSLYHQRQPSLRQ